MADVAELVELPRAVTKAINAGTFAKKFVADRQYDPDFELPDLDELHVTIVLAERRSERITRGKWQYEYDIDVAVQQRVPKAADTVAAIDELLRLPEELSEFFNTHDVTDYPAANYTGSHVKPLWAPEHLRQLGQVTTIVILTFLTVR